MTDPFRCSIASEDDGATGEPIAGTAPTDVDWLLVEDAGPWPAKATAHLDATAEGARVQLVRRHGRADVGDHRARISTSAPGVVPYFLVCTNGRRDLCCAERGRPVAAALTARWPEATWETTHLGGHRFAATLVAFPSGLALGRLDADTAVAACEQLLAGTMPLDHARGRVGWPARAQYADLTLRRRHGWTGLDDVRWVSESGDHGDQGNRVTLDTPDGRTTVVVEQHPGEPRRQSCGDDKLKAAPRFLMR